MKSGFLDKANHFEKYGDVNSILILGDNTIERPFFSVVIPTYKRGDLFGNALRSTMNQEQFSEYEIVIVDNEPYDGSMNETETIVRSLPDKRVKYYRNARNIGMFGNWNRCIELARATWICLLNDDDYLDPHYLSTLGQLLRSMPDVGLISSRFNVVGSYRVVDPWAKQLIREAWHKFRSSVRADITRVRMADFLFGFSCPLVGSCFLRTHAIDLGGFDDELYPSSDLYFIAKFNHYYNNVYFNRKSIYNYRVLANESLRIDKGDFFLDDYHFISFLINTYFVRFKPCLSYLNLAILKDRIHNYLGSNESEDSLRYSFVDVEINKLRTSALKRLICRVCLKIFQIYKYQFRL